jgi:VIT1/CCC1 family predicted Fe2+/Mn2+ transporter
MTLEFPEYLPPEPSPSLSPNGKRIVARPNGMRIAPPNGMRIAPPNGMRTAAPPNGKRITGPLNGMRTATPPNGMRAVTPPNGMRIAAPPNGTRTATPPNGMRIPGPGRPAQAPPRVPHVPRRIAQVASPPAGLRLGGLHRPLREHRDVSGGALRPAVFGAMDGLVTNASLIAGVGGGGANRHTIVLTGLAGLIAGAFSMATGEYISVTSQNELTKAEIELEKLQHFRNPAEKLRKLTHIFVGKGVTPRLAEEVVRQISADPDRAVAIHVREELGIDPDDLPSPWTAAVASFLSFTVGALLPLGSYLLGYPVLSVALALAGVAAVAGGAAVAKLTDRPLLTGGLRQFTAAFLATGMAFAIGHLIGAQVS